MVKNKHFELGGLPALDSLSCLPVKKPESNQYDTQLIYHIVLGLNKDISLGGSTMLESTCPLNVAGVTVQLPLWD